jgi:hypothetical protein
MLPQNPAFLMIGSMKSGTTSVFADMTQHPGIFSPTIKEPGDLCSEAVLTDAGRASYLKLFKGADPSQWVGEATTKYTYFPLIKGVPQRAKSILGPDLRLIFIGRDPLQRLKSHYRHEIQNATISGALVDELDSNPILKDVSNYDMQLAQWLEVFPKEQMLVLQMQDYIDDPAKVINRIWAFLGLAPVEMDHGIVANVTSGKRSPRGILRKIVRSRFYGLYFKRIAPEKLRKSLRQALIPARSTTFDDALPADVEAKLKQALAVQTTQFDAFVKEDRGSR